MPESQPLKFSANPDHDIVNEMVDFWFGQRAVSSSVYVMKTEGKGLESNCSKQVCLGEQTVMGILTCTGVRYAYSIKSQQFVPIVTSYTLPPQGNGFYNFIDGEITLKIIWETYTDPPELGTTTGIDVNLDPGEVPPTVSEGITPDTITPIDVTGDSPIPQTVEEWRELQVILKDGFNLRYRDKTDMDTISHREIQAENDIINSCIPDREHALRIAKKAIWDSMKNISYSPSIPPIFSFYPFLLINIYISFYYLTPKTTKILGISFNNSKDNVSFIVDTKCSTRVGLI